MGAGVFPSRTSPHWLTRSAIAAAPAPLADEPPEKVWAEFRALIASYLDANQGFLSRRAVFTSRESGDYDQLARFGEWDVTQVAVAEVLT